MILNNFSGLLEKFNLNALPVSCKPWGEGHIHETYLIETKDHQPDYILQKINHNIFKDIPGMMANIEAVTRHFRKKLENSDGLDPDRQTLNLVYTRSGNSFFKDEEGSFWRVFVFIPDTVSFQIMTEPSLAYEAGKAIGFFQSALTDLPGILVETVPDFHNIYVRIDQYYAAKEKDGFSRLKGIADEVNFVESRFHQMRNFYNDLKEKAVVRATHNDTKLNNILFDRNNKALCLIDLDTVMPGYVHFDYGDALRTMANTAAEDEPDLSKVMFNAEVYNKFTEGYLSAARSMSNEEEKRMLPYAPIYLTFIIGLRFLTDYLNGDIYFRVHHPGHNLDRARVQFKLVSNIENSLF